MQVGNRTIVFGFLHVDGIGSILDPPGDDSDIVAEVRRHRTRQSHAVVQHHMGIIHDDVIAGIRLLNGCKRIEMK